MARAYPALVDSLAAFVASRLVVLAALVPSAHALSLYRHGWDADIYALISQVGYAPIPADPATSVRLPAFFPLLPAAEHVLGKLGWVPVDWGLVLACVCSFGALVALWLVTADALGPQVARLAVWLLALFPFSIVLSTGYTEGPFLLASVLAYAATRRAGGAAPTAAGVLAFVAGLLRPAGVFMAPLFAWDAVRHRERRTACLAGLAGAIAAPLAFFAYLRHERGDFLASLHAQQRGWHRATSVLDAPGDLGRYTLRAFTTPHATRLVYLLAVPLCVAGLVVLWRRGVTDGPLAFAFAAFLGPLATGSADSLPRFAMATFPYAWAGGLALEHARPRWRIAAFAVSALGLVAVVWASYWRDKLAP